MTLQMLWVVGSFIGGIDPAWIALGGTIFGGVGLKVVEHWLGKNRVKIDYGTTLRKELRESLAAERLDNHELEADRDKWRDAYYDLRDKHINLQTELTLALHKLSEVAENDDTK